MATGFPGALASSRHQLGPGVFLPWVASVREANGFALVFSLAVGEVPRQGRGFLAELRLGNPALVTVRSPQSSHWVLG